MFLSKHLLLHRRLHRSQLNRTCYFWSQQSQNPDVHAKINLTYFHCQNKKNRNLRSKLPQSKEVIIVTQIHLSNRNGRNSKPLIYATLTNGLYSSYYNVLLILRCAT